MVKCSFFVILMLFESVIVFAQDRETVKIACVGNSIIYGSCIKNRFQNSYPGVLSKWLGDGYDVRNYGVSGCTLLNKGDYPYMHQSKFHEVQTFNPDIIIIKLGTNDSKPWNWHFKKDFQDDLNEMLDVFQDLASNPRIYLCTPIPAVYPNYGITDSIISSEIIPRIKKVGEKRKLPVIDLHKGIKARRELYVDGIHPNEKGAVVIASILYETLTGQKAPDYMSK